MQIPSVFYKPNSCQYFPDRFAKPDARKYEAKVTMQVLAATPGLGRVATLAGGILQFRALGKDLRDLKGARNKSDVDAISSKRFRAILTTPLYALFPKIGAIYNGIGGIWSSVEDLIHHLENDASGQVILLDAYRAGSNVVYLAAVISGSPTFIAISLVAQSGEGIYEGVSMIVKQWSAKEMDWGVVGFATLQIGLGALRGYQGASIGVRHGMKKFAIGSQNHVPAIETHRKLDYIKEAPSVLSEEERLELFLDRSRGSRGVAIAPSGSIYC